MSRLKTGRLSFSVVAALSFASLASGPLKAQPFASVPALSFTKPFAGADPLPQIVTIASVGASSLTYTVTSVTSTGGWLSTSPGAGCCETTPSSISAIVTSSPTLAVGSYPGQIVLTQYDSAVTLTIPVTLTVTSTSTSFLDNMPGQMSFWLKTGNTALSSQFIQVRNGGTGSLNWSLTTSTSDGGGWLTTNVTSGTAPTTVTVGVTVAKLPNEGLIAGTYVGQLVFSGGGSTVTVPVAVAVGANIFSQVNPINFTKVFGGADPLPQILTIPSTGTTSLTYTVSSSTANGGSWLSTSPGAGCCETTPSSVTAIVTTSPTLAVGSYTAQIVVLPYDDEGVTMIIPVTLTVAASGSAYLDNLPGQMSFSVVTDGTSITSQLLQIRDGGSGALPWTVTTSTADANPWLTVSAPSGSAPSIVTVGVMVANLPNGGLIAGTFIGQLVVSGNGTTVTVPVSVSVGANIFTQVNAINFTKVFGGANPLPQTLTIPNTGSTSLTYTVSSSTATGGSWLSVSPGPGCCVTTPSSITATVNASPTLAVGTYTAQIVVLPYENEGVTLTIPVTLTVAAAGSSYFDNFPGQISFSLMTGAANNPPAQVVQVRNAGQGSLGWTLLTSTADGGNWLSASATSGTAPSTVSISVQKANLPGSGLVAGTFVGELVFQTAGSVVTVPVSVSVGANVFSQVNAINFVMVSGGANPLPQILTIPSTGATSLTYTVSSSTATGGTWLSVSPGAGCCQTTPSTITATVTASPTLAAGTYTAQIVVSPYDNEGVAMTIPVTLTVASVGSTFFDNIQGQMGFFIPTGSGNPPTQNVQLRNAGSGLLNWTVATTTADGGNWLTASVPSGSAPATVSIGVVASALPSSGLVAGTFVGEVVFNSSGGVATVPVSVVVGTNIYVEAGSLTFSKAYGGANPLSQMVQISSAGTAISSIVASATGNGGAWLSVVPGAGCCSVTPFKATASIVASPTLAPGTYTGQIVAYVYPATLAMTIPVYLNVSGALLTIAKSHTGNFAQGQQGTYSVTVSNGAGGQATSGQVTVTENLPSGLTLVSMAGTGWSCVTNTCTRSDPLQPGIGYLPITVTVNVAANATSPQVNSVSVSGGGSAGANATDSTTITQTGVPAFFTGEDNLGGGVYYLAFPNGSLFGYYAFTGGGWIDHFDMGYEYVDAGSGTDVYLWDLSTGHWWYTGATEFPYLYDFTLNAWIYYYLAPNNPGHYTTNPRYFVNLTTNVIFTM